MMKKKILILLIVMIGIWGWYINEHSPKNFQHLLGFRMDDVVEIHLVWKDQPNSITDHYQIDQILSYLSSFKYIKKTVQEISQDNLKNNKYNLKGVWFVKSKGKTTYMDFCKDEVRSGITYYYIPDGHIDENTLKTLSGE